MNTNLKKASEEEIPTITAKANASYEEVSEGTHAAVCFGMVDLGTNDYVYQGKQYKSREVVIMFEIIDEQDPTGKNKEISKFLSVSLGKKSKMLTFLETWRGRNFTAEEKDGFNITRLIGAKAMIGTKRNDKNRIEIGSIMPPNKLIAASITQTKENFVFSLERPDWSKFEKLNDFFKKKIESSEEYKLMMNIEEKEAVVEGPDTALIEEELPF